MGKYDTYRQAVLEASLWLSQHGFFGSIRGTGGNVSVRIEAGSLMAVTPSSIKYHELVTEDICIVDLNGDVVEAKRAPSVETGMHAVIYRSRPDVNAVVHTHQIFGSVFALVNHPIPALFDEVSFTLGPTVEIVPYGLSGSTDLVNNVAGKLSNNANAYIIQNHGIIALGKDLDRAMLAAELLEKVAHIYCLALATGKAVTMLPVETREMAQGMRSYEAAEAQKKRDKE
ncbi:MAG: class II aldolase/adducin family protein [Deltaproteobacteria bacterium]|nr:class II aldolase/adducin family protein [Candidatus Zymogenaceae bacterium]